MPLFDKNRLLFTIPHVEIVLNVIANQCDNSYLNRLTMLEDYNTGSTEWTMIPFNTAGLDDRILAQNDNFDCNVRAIKPQDLTDCQSYRCSIKLQSSGNHLFQEFSDSITASFETSAKNSSVQVAAS